MLEYNRSPIGFGTIAEMPHPKRCVSSTRLRILHVSDTPLPDARIEKMACSTAKREAKLYFAGPPSNRSALPETGFERLFILNWSPKARVHLPLYWRTVKSPFKRLVESLKPDLLHAHNIFAARLCYELGSRMVYDDHECWPLELKALRKYSSKTGLINVYLSYLASKWSKAIIDEVPVIVASPTVAQEYNQYGKAFLVPNFPNEFEVSLMGSQAKPHGTLSCVIVGMDFPALIPFRDTSGLLDIFSNTELARITLIGPSRSLINNPRIRSLGYLSHVEMLRELCRHHVGIIPWRPHWFHKYCNPNKAYQYAHAGLAVIVPYTMQPVIEALGRDLCLTFRDFQELAELLKDLSRDVKYVLKLGRETMEHARERLVWELYEDTIREAYEAAFT